MQWCDSPHLGRLHLVNFDLTSVLDGFQPKSDGDGLQPTSDGFHPKMDGLHPKLDGFLLQV